MKKKIVIHYHGSYMDIKLTFDNENKALKNLKDFKKQHEKKTRY